MDGERKQKLAFFLAVFLLAGGTALANQVKVGLHAGLSVPNLRSGSDNIYSQGFTSRTGPYFGLFVNYKFSSDFALRAEINYASQGGKRNGMQPITIDLSGLDLPIDMILYADFHNEAILNYIEIPVLIELGWGMKPHFFLNAGPYVGFLLNAKTVTSGTSSIYLDADRLMPVLVPPDYQPLPPVSFEASTNIKSEINTTNFGIAGGAGVSFAAGPGDIIVAFQFSLGLTNIQKNTAVNGENNTGAVVVTLGYSFTLRSSQ